MPGIGMGDKYTWLKPPAFYKEPGDYDYMPGALLYKAKNIADIEGKMATILDAIHTVVINCEHNLYDGDDISNLNALWNNFFSIDEEPQRVLELEKFKTIGNETKTSYQELEKAVNSYFSEAKSTINKINSALTTLEENANKIQRAWDDINGDDKNNKEASQQYLDEVKKYGEEYNFFTLTKIGRWVY